MLIVNVRNVQRALPIGMQEMMERGVRRNSRNGPVLQMPFPVSTIYSNPCERVMFHPWRDANPFFHFYESLWMLNGNNDVKSLTKYVKRMENFSDDGRTFNAAYGYRWRRARRWTEAVRFWCGERIDQLSMIIDGLRRNPECRRQVLQIWDHVYDLGTPTKDAACNVSATFQINADGALDMVVFCRSNDMIWGAYGANAVHFSFLLEYMASSIGVRVGSYTQISVNFHAYEDIYEQTRHRMRDHGLPDDPYTDSQISPYPIMRTTQSVWDEDLHAFMIADGEPSRHDYRDSFFTDVAMPIVQAHRHYRANDLRSAHYAIARCQASDWRFACIEWLNRRSRCLSAPR